MWWNKKKLQHLSEELRSIVIFDRLYASRSNLTLEDHYAQAMRQMRQSELLAEIGRLTAKKKLPKSLNEQTPIRSAQQTADVVRLMKNLVSAVNERDGKIRREQQSAAAA